MHRKSLLVASRAGTLLLYALVASASFHAIASAQWLPDRNYTEGPGFRVGDLEIHPGVAARGGYDTNIFRSEKGREEGAAILAITPHVNIKTLSRQRQLTGGEAAGATAPVSRPLTFDLGFATTFFSIFKANAPTNVEFDTDVALALKPDAPVGLDVTAGYQRTIRPFTEFTGSSANNEYARNSITPSIRLRAQSRGGTLRTYLGYAPGLTIYESQTFNYLNVISHGVIAGSSWRFLPFTALVTDASVNFTNYFDPTTANAAVLVSDSRRFQVRAGLNGNITPLLSLRVLAGYVYENYIGGSPLEDYENVVGEAVVGFGRANSKVEGGYQRTVLPSSLGGWTQYDRGMLRGSTLIGRVVALSVEGGAGKVRYGRILGPRNAAGVSSAIGVNRENGEETTHRLDTRVDASAHVEYRATNWLAIMTDFSAFATLTNYQYLRGMNVPPDPAEFITYQIFGGIRLHY
jgi:hypothetical protein